MYMRKKFKSSANVNLQYISTGFLFKIILRCETKIISRKKKRREEKNYRMTPLQKSVEESGLRFKHANRAKERRHGSVFLFFPVGKKDPVGLKTKK